MNPIMTNATLQGSCPAGGLWYTCRAQTPSFLGCCTSNPCNGKGCPVANLRPAGLGAGAGPRECENDSSFEPNIECLSGGDWYGCQTRPTFQGCCLGEDPCDVGYCPTANLRPASFVENFNEDKLMLPCGMDRPTKSASSTSLSSSINGLHTSSKTSAPSAPSTSPSTSPTGQQASAIYSDKGNISLAPALAGGIGGGILFLIIFLLFLYHRRQKQSRHHHTKVIPFAPTPDFSKEFPAPSTINSPGPPPYENQNFPESPNDIRRSQVYEIGTSSTRYPEEEVGHTQGLGIAGAGSSPDLQDGRKQMGGGGNRGSTMLYTGWQTYTP